MTSATFDDLVSMSTRLQRRVTAANRSSRDFLALVRDAMQTRHLTTITASADQLDYPSQEQLRSHGLELVGDRLTVYRWFPKWLDSGVFPVGLASSRREQRQSSRTVQADDFYRRLTGRDAYRTAGQRLAVRSALSMSPGDVLTCVLPTGSGKTDVLLTKSLHLRPQQTLVIVPTVSLALDLERRLQAQLEGTDQFAYLGNMTLESKQEFRRRVAGGEQWLTITSPEAACASLAEPLAQSARAGRLALIVIDEAHIVAEWGDDFRPEFQLLAALRKRLERLSPKGKLPKTILLTGTLDQHGYDTLQDLFEASNEVFVSDQATRPEPEWWVAPCESEEVKRERLLEAVSHLPRPALIYTSLHESEKSTNVRQVVNWLREAGYISLCSVSGSNNPEERSSVVERLRLSTNRVQDDVDIVVATSAFGMGIDIEDIRTVIHLCLPESVNRFYQEVGRSGRDGQATTSLVLWTEADKEVAEGLAEAQQIGFRKAWERWRRLLLSSQPHGNNLYLDLSTPWPGVKFPFSDANIYWNKQTLLGMQRAGMIRLCLPDLEGVSADLSDEDLADEFKRRVNKIEIEVSHGDLNENTFKSRFKSSGITAKTGGQVSLSTVTSLLANSTEIGQDCLSNRIARYYEIVDREIGLVPVIPNCGGCSKCRRVGQTPKHSPTDVYSSGYFETPIDESDLLFNTCSIVCIKYEPQLENFDELFDSFIDRLSGRRPIRLWGNSAVNSNRYRLSKQTPTWWESASEVITRLNDPTRVLTIVDADSIDDPETLKAVITRIPDRTPSIVITNPNREDPFDPRQLLPERFNHLTVEQALLRR